MAEEHACGSVEYQGFEAAILKYAGANAALNDLCQHGIERNGFLELLALSAYMLLPADRKPQPWWQIPGMPPRRLSNLADRLEQLADDLQRIDSHSFIQNTYGLLMTHEEEQFKQLPELLRARAYILGVQISVGSHTSSLIDREMEKRAKLNLIVSVRHSSVKHRPMYADVALLLTAALYALGCDEEITPESLKSLWHDDLRRSETSEIST